MKWWFRRHTFVIGYLVVVVAVLGNYEVLREEHNAERARNVQELVAICDSNAEIRGALLDLIGPQPQVIPVPAGADTALTQAIESANRKSDDSWRKAHNVLGD